MSEQGMDTTRKVAAREDALFSRGDPVCWSVNGAGMLFDRAGHAEQTTLGAAATWMEGTIREVGAATATVAFTGSDGRTGVAMVPLNRIHGRPPGRSCPEHPPTTSHTEHRAG